MDTIHISLGANSYDVHIGNGILLQAGALLDLARRVLVVTDTGVPEVYAKTVCRQCSSGYIVCVEQGEQSKSIQTFEYLLSELLRLGFTRGDAVVAVGGGVIGDLAGFTAACYMRGIDFYNIPTTVLSQVDSGVGGKTAVNLNGVKNIVGAFFQPKKVLIDVDVLQTLPRRQISNGLAESLKMSLTSDAALFRLFENEDPYTSLEKIIFRSVQIKAAVVEQDEREAGLRSILNFGHTIGHAIESEEELNGLYHGECVALGMLPMITNEDLRGDVKQIYKKISLPVSFPFDVDTAMGALLHDKKSAVNGIKVTMVDQPGSFIQKTLQPADFPPLFDIIRKR